MDDLREIWQKQEVEEMKFSVEELRAKAAQFQSRIRWRNLREQVACLVVVGMSGAMFVNRPETVFRVSSALMIAGAIYVAWHLQRAGSPPTPPVEMARTDGLSFYRSELMRQRDLLQGIWKWYLGPLIPGPALLAIYGMITAPARLRWFPILYAILAALFCWFVTWLNHRAAQRLSSQIAELDGTLGAS
jgi:small neutral amino acid transporter SnatA (MarC family)